MINDKLVEWGKYTYPSGYIVKDGILVFNNGIEYVEVSGTPFVLCAKTKPLSDGSRYYTVRYEIDGEQKEFLAKTTELSLKRNLNVLLATHSFKFNDGRYFNRVLDYIKDCMIQYGSKLKTIYATEMNGWNNEKDVFAIGREGITIDGLIPIHTVLTNSKHIDVFMRRGSEKKWVEDVREILGYDLVRFMFYDAMTAPLLKILGIESHAFEHAGKTRSGKTTISRVIASAIGNPREQLIIPGNTNIGILAHVNAMSDLPTFVEEATTKKAKEVIKSAIYEISNGMEKARGQANGKLKDDVKTFTAVTHITCEGSIREEMQHAGEMYRLNSMKEMLPHVKGIRELNKGIEGNYGFFFPRYIVEILKNKEMLGDLFDECFDKIIVSEDNLIESSKNLYAGIMVAGFLCEKVFRNMGIESKDYESVVLEYFKKCVIENLVELDHIRALRNINDWVIQNQISFLTTFTEVQDMKVKEPFGVLKNGYIFIVGIQFKKMMREWDFGSYGNIAKCWFEDGITESYDGTGFHRFKMNNKTTYGIKISEKKMEKLLF